MTNRDNVGMGPAPPRLECLEDFDAHAVYRFVREPQHATEFVAGRIFVSTLDHVRSRNGDLVDGDDGTLTYSAETVTGRLTNADVAKRLFINNGRPDPAIEIGPGNRSVIAFDAFVMCMTLRYDAVRMQHFGPSCVRIEEPREFVRRLTVALHAVEPISRVLLGRVKYGGRAYRDLEDPPGIAGFASLGSMSVEDEVRAIWIPARQVISHSIARELRRDWYRAINQDPALDAIYDPLDEMFMRRFSVPLEPQIVSALDVAEFCSVI